MFQQENPTAPAIFQDVDGRFRVIVRQGLLTTMRELCAAAAGRETGGILAGYYNNSHATAIITRLEGPPADSKMKPDRFYRGTQGLRDLLERLWAGQEYYLGEWHYHPGARGKPAARTGARCRPLRTMPQSVAPNRS